MMLDDVYSMNGYAVRQSSEWGFWVGFGRLSRRPSMTRSPSCMLGLIPLQRLIVLEAFFQGPFCFVWRAAALEFISPYQGQT